MVDDNDDFRIGVGTLLIWLCDTASSGKEALEMYQTARDSSTPYELIILDCAMPEMDGFEVAKIIRQDDADTKIVFLTAYASETMAQVMSKKYGATALWGKPIEGLREKIEEVLALRDQPANCGLDTETP